MRIFMSLLLLFSFGCSEYDLSGGPGKNNGNKDDEGSPVEGPQPNIKLDPETVTFGYLMVDCPA